MNELRAVGEWAVGVSVAALDSLNLGVSSIEILATRRYLRAVQLTQP